MDRLVRAFKNSMRAFVRLSRSETAFQQELALFVVAFPVGWWLAGSWSGYGILLASILFLIVVEVLNTGIEAACNAVSRDFDIDIQLAKDCGSLAVLLAMVLVAAVWGFAAVEAWRGVPV